MTSRVFIRRVDLVLLVVLLALMLVAPPSQAQNMAYVKDLPTPAEIAKRFAVADAEQSLGRQCAALDMLWRGTAFFTYREVDTPEMQAAKKIYYDAIAALRERYAREVRALDTPEAQHRWRVRLCGNAPDGIHPLTGKPDESFPGLKQRVTVEEVVSLFRPSVMAAYERRVAEGKAAVARRAASDAQQAREAEERQAAASIETVELFLTLAVQAVGWGLLVWLIIINLWRSSSFNATRNIVLIGRREYDLKSVAGVVTGAPQKSRETIVTGGGGGGGPSNAPVTVSVSSYTITHDTIFLRDEQGNIHHLQLRNWDFPCAHDHEIDAMWLERKGEHVGNDYVMIRNFTIDKSWSNGELLSKLIAPLHEGVMFVLMALACLMTVGFGLILAVPAWFWMHRRWRKQAQALASSIRETYAGLFRSATS